MTRAEAAITLMKETKVKKATNTGAARCKRACVTLGLTAEECVEVLGYLDFCDYEGNPYPTIKRIW